MLIIKKLKEKIQPLKLNLLCDQSYKKSLQKYLEIEDQIEAEKRDTQKQIDTLEHDNKSLESRIKSYQDHSECQLSDLLFETFVFRQAKILSVVKACSICLLPSYLLGNTVNSRLADTRLLGMLTITDKIQIPGESY